MSKATIAKLERALHYTNLALEAAKSEINEFKEIKSDYNSENVRRSERVKIAKRMREIGFTQESICDCLNISISTVKVYLK